MRRRDFIAAVGGAVLAKPLAARAQQGGTSTRIAWLHPSISLADMRGEGGFRNTAALLDELRRLGYVEGTNLILERYSGESRPERYAALAHEVVARQPALIFTSGAEMTRRLQAETRTIPMVALLTDPVATGFIANFAHPGGNITGVAIDAGIEIWGKRVAILKEAVPAASRVGFLGSRSSWEHTDRAAAASRAAAQQLGLTLVLVEASGQEADYRRTLGASTGDHFDALVVSDEAEHFPNRKLIVDLASQARLPAIYPFQEYVAMGGLLGYTIDLPEIYREAARQIDRVLKGGKPAELPFYQPTKFELIVNLKTAKALGLGLPPPLVLRADEVID